MNIDLTTLQGWDDLPNGTYDITVGATADGYTRIIQSSAVSVVKETTIVYAIYPNIINGYLNSGTDSEIEQGGTANIYFTPNEGYEYPSSVTVTNADYSYSNGRIILSNPIGDVRVDVVCPAVTYNISTTVSNGSYSGSSTISYDETATVTITADSGYSLPSSITVTNAQYTYDSSTGIIVLSNPIGDVSVSVVCESASTAISLTNWTADIPEFEAKLMCKWYSDKELTNQITECNPGDRVFMALDFGDTGNLDGYTSFDFGWNGSTAISDGITFAIFFGLSQAECRTNIANALGITAQQANQLYLNYYKPGSWQDSTGGSVIINAPSSENSNFRLMFADSSEVSSFGEYGHLVVIMLDIPANVSNINMPVTNGQIVTTDIKPYMQNIG